MDDFDLFADTAAGDVRDPYPDYARARREAPVALVDANGFESWVVYRYDDVAAVLRNPEVFSSRVYAPTIGAVMGPTMLAMDGVEHRTHRALVASAFRRRALGAWEGTLVEPTVRSLIDRFAASGEADLVRELAAPFPIRVISGILGIPPGDEETFARLSIELISITVDVGRGLEASRALGAYFAEVLAERRREPRDDLISALATAEIDGRRLPDEEIHAFLRLLLPAGAETTFRLLGSLLFALLSDAPALDAVRADRTLIAAAIEEALRWEAPVQFLSREVTEGTDLAGVKLPPGTAVSCALGSANRDETRYADPDRFDLRRYVGSDPPPPPHLAFADGPHRCLGEHLARLEVTVALDAVLDRLPGLRLEPGDRDPHVHGWAFRSPTCVPVRFDPS